MGKSLIRKNLIFAAITGSALAGVVGQASAAQWVGTWDPVYLRTYNSTTGGGTTAAGSPFNWDGTFLYFSGTALFDSGSCSTAVSSLTACADWKITDIKLTIGTATGFVPGTLAPLGIGATEVLSFDNSTGPSITKMTFSGGNLTGVSAAFHPIALQEQDGNNISQIQNPFTNNDPSGPALLLPFMSVSFGINGPADSFATFNWKAYEDFDMDCTKSDTSTFSLTCGSQDARITFTPAIPEPSTYALMGLGLAAVVAMRRRSAKNG